MLLTICHTTTYRYARPVTLAPHRLMLCPRGHHDLTLLSTSLDCSPPADLAWTQDVFGNLIATATFSAPTDTLIVTSRLVVEQSAAAWPLFEIAPHAHLYPFAYSDEERIDLGALMVPGQSDADGRLGRWVRGFIAFDPTDTLSLLKDINAGIAAQIAYGEREEEGTRSALDTLALGAGACRDMAALFIEAVRQLGFGARAVSGYLFDPQGGEQHQSTHAWAEVYLPCAGWIAFDPANAGMGGANLVPVAIARDITQIRPIAGNYAGAPEDFLNLAVDVLVTPGAGRIEREGP